MRTSLAEHPVFKEGAVLRCPVATCNSPLGKLEDGKLHIQRFQGGSVPETIVEVQHYDNGHTKITCSRCGGGHIFVDIKDGLVMNDSVTASVDN